MMKLLILVVSLSILALGLELEEAEFTSRNNHVLAFEFEQFIPLYKRASNFLPLSIKGTMTFKNDKFFGGPEDNVESFQMSVIYTPNPIFDEAKGEIYPAVPYRRSISPKEVVIPGMTFTEQDLDFYFELPDDVNETDFDYSKELVGQLFNKQYNVRFGWEDDDGGDFNFGPKVEIDRPMPGGLWNYVMMILNPDNYDDDDDGEIILKRNKKDIVIPDEIYEMLEYDSFFKLKSVRRVDVPDHPYGNPNSNNLFKFNFKAVEGGFDFGIALKAATQSTSVQALVDSFKNKRNVNEIPVYVKGVVGYSKLEMINMYGDNALDPKNMDYLKVDLVAIGGDNVEYSLHTWSFNRMETELYFFGQPDFTKELVGQVMSNGKKFGELTNEWENGAFFLYDGYSDFSIWTSGTFIFEIGSVFNYLFSYDDDDGEPSLDTIFLDISLDADSSNDGIIAKSENLNGGHSNSEKKLDQKSKDYIDSVKEKINQHEMSISTAYNKENSEKRFTFSEVKAVSYLLNDLTFALESFAPFRCEIRQEPKPIKHKVKKFGEYQDCLFPQNKQMECYSYKALFASGTEPISCEVEECSSVNFDAFNRKCSKISGAKDTCKIDAAKKQVCVKREACTGARRGDTCARVYNFIGETKVTYTKVDDVDVKEDICKFRNKSGSQSTEYVRSVIASVVAPFNSESMEFKSKSYCH